jgi:hypothetical protein
MLANNLITVLRGKVVEITRYSSRGNYDEAQTVRSTATGADVVVVHGMAAGRYTP